MPLLKTFLQETEQDQESFVRLIRQAVSQAIQRGDCEDFDELDGDIWVKTVDIKPETIEFEEDSYEFYTEFLLSFTYEPFDEDYLPIDAKALGEVGAVYDDGELELLYVSVEHNLGDNNYLSHEAEDSFEEDYEFEEEDEF